MRQFLFASTVAMAVSTVALSGAYAQGAPATGAPASQAAPAQAAASQAAAPASPQPWKYKTKRLDRAQLDALFAKPGKLVVLDVRRPDELTAKGGFPVYLSIQAKDVPNELAYIPKHRKIVTVSNRAHRAGDVGDFLSAHGYHVVGAAGVLDYEDQGGTLIKIVPPAPKAP